MKNKREQILLLGNALGSSVINSFIKEPDKWGPFVVNLQSAMDKNTTIGFLKQYIKDIKKTDKDINHWISGPASKGIGWKDLIKEIEAFRSGVEVSFLVAWAQNAKKIKEVVDKAVKDDGKKSTK